MQGQTILDAFRYEKDAAGIVTITMDMPGPVNAMNALYRNAMAATLDRLATEPNLKGVILASAKSTFFAGGDLKELLAVQPDQFEAFKASIVQTRDQLRRLERLAAPVVAALNGAALGGGLEIALACHRRILVDEPSAVVGLPEVTLGLLPGGGGTVRMVHMLGVEKALPLLMEGRRLKGEAALRAGIVDELVDRQDMLLAAARAWIKTVTADAQAVVDACTKPWDRKGYDLPGGSLRSPRIAQTIMAGIAATAARTRGLLPAPERILDVIAQAAQLDFDSALEVETRGLCHLAMTPQAKNIITTMFFQMNAINSGANRPKQIPRSLVRKLGVLGAGMMGQGIAYVAAKAGIEVVLLDVSIEAAQKGKAYAERLLDKGIAKGRTTEVDAQELLARIRPTADYAELAGADLVVEAVFENVDLKAKVTLQAEPELGEGGVFATNTSTLPITLLAKAARRPEQFIGIHFFSPVERMPLVEIICGEQTSDAALARAFDFARQIGMTAIVVNDSLGFFTSRTIGTFIDESCRLLQEGVDPVLIENLARQIGMPAGPLTVFDEVSLELMRKVNDTHKAMGVFGKTYDASASDAVGSLMIGDHGRSGRHYGGGFYEYPQNGEKHIWPGLYELFHKPEQSIPADDVKDRILFRQVIEAIRCLQEGVLRSAADGNVGSILGIGAPAWTGGFIQFVNTYGLDRFVGRARALQQNYGERFAPPHLVVSAAAEGRVLD